MWTMLSCCADVTRRLGGVRNPPVSIGFLEGSLYELLRNSNVMHSRKFTSDPSDHDAMP
ncbi:hypothetical protein PHLGIDRAFT_245092 [Phlebiopsis gigantea 11061_1 CR5-6]|uniref:Uncharacterized protein n=1 Tax=Phlebiopsis gigantea (strain 11061_1 CR5-6) TaxID=745531 RepID=A0A0C3S1S8_PHLG1|nr:hypothetical protein PHLGIDRAFT_245092 [Phlebiopsis gigantea 11061_1 CR5-6]